VTLFLSLYLVEELTGCIRASPPKAVYFKPFLQPAIVGSSVALSRLCNLVCFLFAFAHGLIFPHHGIPALQSTLSPIPALFLRLDGSLLDSRALSKDFSLLLGQTQVVPRLAPSSSVVVFSFLPWPLLLVRDAKAVFAFFKAWDLQIPALLDPSFLLQLLLVVSLPILPPCCDPIPAFFSENPLLA